MQTETTKIQTTSMKGLPSYIQFINEHLSLFEKSNTEIKDEKIKWKKAKVTANDKNDAEYTKSTPTRKTALDWSNSDFKTKSGNEIVGKENLHDKVHKQWLEEFPDEIKLGNKI